MHQRKFLVCENLLKLNSDDIISDAQVCIFVIAPPQQRAVHRCLVNTVSGSGENNHQKNVYLISSWCFLSSRPEDHHGSEQHPGP